MGTILKIQQAFQEAGYQWTEHIYNDGSPWNCSLQFTRDRSPHALHTYPRPDDCVGWGRFERLHAWLQAGEWLEKQLAECAK